MTLKECYEQMNGDYAGTLHRLCSEQLVARFLVKFLNDTNYASLEKSVAVKDGEAAFAAAHTLKGVALNLGLIALANPAEVITEALRGGWNEEAVNLLPAVTSAYENTINAIQSWQA